MKLRTVFIGTAELSCASLSALLNSPHFSVVAVVTQPDKPRGRALKLQPSPVKELAGQHNLPVMQPERARNEQFINELRAFDPDITVVAAYGQILPQTILDLPRYSCVNVHTSLLPKYRGAAPIQWALLNDERETGVTIMQMDAGLDTGMIIAQQSTAISNKDTSETLHERLAEMGAALLVQTIPDFVAGKITPRAQPAEGITYAPKIKKEDGKLEWNQSARTLWSRVRALTPWPGTFTFIRDAAHSVLLKVWRAEIVHHSGNPGEILAADHTGIIVACGTDSLRIIELQREGGRRLGARDFLAGHCLKPGDRLG